METKDKVHITGYIRRRDGKGRVMYTKEFSVTLDELITGEIPEEIKDLGKEISEEL